MSVPAFLWSGRGREMLLKQIYEFFFDKYFRNNIFESNQR